MSDFAIRWLIFEGLLPLLGAGILYTIWGGCRYIAASDKSTFAFVWWQAIDPLGWLYGAVIIACQSGLKGLEVGDAGLLPSVCFMVAAICFLLLISAMTERGQDSTWQAPRSLQILSAALVIAILCAGFQVQGLAITGVKP
ncbi:MAG: hypothetical protein ACRER2_03570 [Methylococcales bacterium]